MRGRVACEGNVQRQSRPSSGGKHAHPWPYGSARLSWRCRAPRWSRGGGYSPRSRCQDTGSLKRRRTRPLIEALAHIIRHSLRVEVQQHKAWRVRISDIVGCAGKGASPSSFFLTSRADQECRCADCQAHRRRCAASSQSFRRSHATAASGDAP